MDLFYTAMGQNVTSLNNVAPDFVTRITNRSTKKKKIKLSHSDLVCFVLQIVVTLCLG